MIASVRIGEAARETGVTIKAIRHYEAVGLLTTLEREGRYRRLSTENVDQLRLIAHCRGLGFTLREIREVLRAVAAAKPACPDPVTMLAVVERRLRALDLTGSAPRARTCDDAGALDSPARGEGMLLAWITSACRSPMQRGPARSTRLPCSH